MAAGVSPPLVTERRASLFAPRRPVTSYFGDNFTDLPNPRRCNTHSERPHDQRHARIKARPLSQSFTGDREVSPTGSKATINNPSTDPSSQCHLSRSSSSHRLPFRQTLQSIGRKFSLSIRPKSASKIAPAADTSYASGIMSRHSTYQHHERPSKWLRGASVSQRHSPVPAVPQYPNYAPPPYSCELPRPATNRQPPSACLPPPIPSGNAWASPVWALDRNTGAAARAAAAAQNESLHLYQRQFPGVHVTMSSQTKQSRLSRDSESGIGIGYSDGWETSSDRQANVIRRDPTQMLPTELMEHTLCYLDAESLARAERVSHEWRTKARSQFVWRQVFERDYDPSSRQRPRRERRRIGGRDASARGDGQDWHKMYALRRKIDERWATGQAAAIYLNGHEDSVYCVQFDEHKIITGSRDRTIRVWDTRTFQCIRKIGSPHYRGSRCAERALTGVQPYGAFHIESVSPKDPPDVSAPYGHHDASILCLQFDDELLVTGSSDRTAIVWSINENYRPIFRLRGHRGSVLDVCLDDRCVVTCSKDTTIHVWDRRSGELIRRLLGHRGPVNAVQLRGNLLASASGDGMAKLWSIGDGVCIKEFSSRDRGLACIEFSEDGTRILAGGNDQVIYEYDTCTGDLVQELVGHRGLVRSLHLDSANHRVISGSYDMSIKVWDGDGSRQNNGSTQQDRNSDHSRDISGGDRGRRRRPKINFTGWTTSWMLAAKSDYRKIVCTSQDGRVAVMDFGYGLEGVEMLEGY